MNEEGRALGQKEIPAMTTMSLRAVAETFKAAGSKPTYLITALRARASDMEPSKPDVLDSALGYEGWKARVQSAFSLNYAIKFDEDGKPRNPLDSSGFKKISDALTEIGLEDAAVSRVRVLIRDPELGERAGNEEDLWHMTLISDPVEGKKDREKVKEHDINTALIKQEGFKYRVLNCRDLIDRKQELTLPRTQHTPTIKWVGNTFGGMRSKPTVSQRIQRAHMGEFGLRKVYGPGQEDTVILLSVSR